MKNFRQLDDLVLDLKGLVLARELLRERGTDVSALEPAIDRLRDRLACLVSRKPEAAGQSSRRAATSPRRAMPGGMRPAEIQLLT